MTKAEFEIRYRERFSDPAFNCLAHEMTAIIEAAWDAYIHSPKSPHTRKAGD